MTSLKYIIPTVLGLIITACVPLTPTDSYASKALIMDNVKYENTVGMVQLYPLNDEQGAFLQYPVIEVGDPGLVLVFDVMEDDSEYLYAKYISCNADWTKSNLQDLQFITVYNEFPINNYSYSSNTHTNYVNYSTTLPTPDKSGNYIVEVYRNSHPEDALFTQRFLVVNQQCEFEVQIKNTAVVSRFRQDQQLNMEIKYPEIENVNPMREFKVVLLQNHNWNTAIRGLEPTQFLPYENKLIYQQFSGENTFPGLNEYRYFDLRSVDYRGMNVANVRKEPDQVVAFLGIDKSRGDLAYTQINSDLNGGYYLQNTDPNDSQLQSEYVKVFFELMNDSIDGQVYVTGRFNNWNITPENQLHYDTQTGSYKGYTWLKQGYYNYFYWAVDKNNHPYYMFEGNHYQTQNDYEVLFYYRNPFYNYDELIGYRLISSRI